MISTTYPGNIDNFLSHRFEESVRSKVQKRLEEFNKKRNIKSASSSVKTTRTVVPDSQQGVSRPLTSSTLRSLFVPSSNRRAESANVRKSTAANISPEKLDRGVRD